MENTELKKANERRLEHLQELYNSNNEEISKYLTRFDDLAREIADDETLHLLDLYRMFAATMAKITTSTYHDSEAEFQAAVQTAHRKVGKFFSEFLKEGSAEADPDDFKISNLMMFTCDLIETIMWKYFVGIQDPETMDLKNYMEESDEAGQNEE